MTDRAKKKASAGGGVPVHDWSTVQNRVLWLLATRFSNTQSEMAGTLGLTPMVLSRVASGKRPPGSRLLRAIIEKLGVEADWLFHGRGEPFPGTAAGPGSEGRTPILEELLPGRLTGDTERPVEQWIDVPALFSPTQYWFLLPSRHPLLTVKSLGFRAGDLLLLETDPTRFRPVERMWEHLCVVKNPHGREPATKLGLVSYFEGAEEEGPERLVVDILDSIKDTTETVDEFVFRRYPGGEVRSLHRQLTIDRKAKTERPAEKEPGMLGHLPPEIKPGDIVAIWTGILIRSGYSRTVHK